MFEFKLKRKIEFSDTDLAGIVHFSRFFVFMETAEHCFLNALGSSVHTTHEGKRIGWPRVSASCDFFRPVRFEDEIELHLRVVRKGRSSMTYQVESHHRGELVARGEIRSVCCEMTPSGPRSCRIPEALARQIEEAPEEPEETEETVAE